MRSHWQVSWNSFIFVINGNNSILFKHSSHSFLKELQKEKNTATVQLDQSSRRLSQLEEEKKSADQSLKRTQGLLDDIKGELGTDRGG